jgi:hypothetical protein
MKKRAAKKTAKPKRRVPADIVATRRALALAEKMTDEELFQIAVRAGIYTKSGRLRKPYRDDQNPSACRPTD